MGECIMPGVLPRPHDHIGERLIPGRPREQVISFDQGRPHRRQHHHCALAADSHGLDPKAVVPEGTFLSAALRRSASTREPLSTSSNLHGRL